MVKSQHRLVTPRLSRSNSEAFLCTFSNANIAHTTESGFSVFGIYTLVRRKYYIDTCLHVCLFTCTCIHAYIHTCIHTYRHKYIYTYLHAYLLTYLLTVIHRHIHPYVRTNIHANKQTHTYKNSQTYIHQLLNSTAILEMSCGKFMKFEAKIVTLISVGACISSKFYACVYIHTHTRIHIFWTIACNINHIFLLQI